MRADIRGAKSYHSAMTQETWLKYSEWPLVGAAFLFLTAYSILVIAEPPDPYATALALVMGSTWLAFGIDYIVKLLLARRRGRWFVRHPLDLLMVVLPVARPLRLLRPFTLRQVMERAPGTAIRTRVMAYVIVSAILLIYTVALSVLSFEKNAPNANITTMGDSLWWAVVTITTIGYGDYYPVTVPGRWAAAALMVGGFAVLSMVTAAVSSWLVESVTAATHDRRQADEIISSEELARLAAQINRLHDQLARERGASEDSPENAKARKEPGTQGSG
ncbi:voltage-gated potassium channel [Arthrobacter sp. ov118]|nr:voltage-gated potassium channel [Arthrobacter sp. ov118]